MKKDTKKTQEVKVKMDEGIKKIKEVEDTQTFTEKEKKALDGFFEQLKKSVMETSEAMGLSTKENHSFYVSFCYVDEGKTVFDAIALETNLNLYERHGYDIKLLSSKIKNDHNIKSDVVILNVVKLED